MSCMVNVFWFRRDLRLQDNVALYYALKSEYPIVPIFIFDTNILSKLEDKDDKRLVFIHLALQKLENELQKLESTLSVYYGTPLEIWAQILKKYSVNQVFVNEDYEPYAIQRDTEIENFLINRNVSFKKYKDHVIFAKNEVLKDDKTVYQVFTPYSKKWRSLLEVEHYKLYPTEKYFHNFFKCPPRRLPSLQQIGFNEISCLFPDKFIKDDIIKYYHETRDYPYLNQTSKLGVHLRFGTISIRAILHRAIQISDSFVNELIWRDFYQMILFHYPNVVNQSFKAEYDRIPWRNNEFEFQSWCNGQTGYPIVDAGMRQLNATGYMHNRVRMIVASFLAKHLLVDWRWGESYFAKKLIDFDLAANNGGWQWAAGTGCDAAPYFRVFNPTLQTQKFDPKLDYIKQWVPEYGQLSYIQPIVEHNFARNRCLQTYALALKNT